MEISNWTKRQIDIVNKWYNDFNSIGLIEAYTGLKSLCM